MPPELDLTPQLADSEALDAALATLKSYSIANFQTAQRHLNAIDRVLHDTGGKWIDGQFYFKVYVEKQTQWYDPEQVRKFLYSGKPEPRTNPKPKPKPRPKPAPKPLPLPSDPPQATGFNDMV